MLSSFNTTDAVIKYKLAHLTLQQELLILAHHQLMLLLSLLICRGMVKNFKQKRPYISPNGSINSLQQFLQEKMYPLLVALMLAMHCLE
jgi:hypothetical protein